MLFNSNKVPSLKFNSKLGIAGFFCYDKRPDAFRLFCIEQKDTEGCFNCIIYRMSLVIPNAKTIESGVYLLLLNESKNIQPKFLDRFKKNGNSLRQA